MNDIEQHLAALPPPQLPPDWRKDILAAANAARETQEKTRTSGWSSRVGWGALAAVWMVIFSLHFSTERTVPSLAKINPVIFQEHWRQQKQMVAELLAPEPEIEAPVPPKALLPATPDPRSSDRLNASRFSSKV